MMDLTLPHYPRRRDGNGCTAALSPQAADERGGQLPGAAFGRPKAVLPS